APACHWLELDEPEDLERADALLRARERAQTAAGLPSDVKALVLDFDGVLTDNRVHCSENGEESVSCWRSDGIGLAAVQATGVRVLVLSKERNPVVSIRCEKLSIECLQAVDDKCARLQTWLDNEGLAWEQVVFVGNDSTDTACMKRAGFGVAVADAHDAALRASNLVLSRNGGYGAVRECCDLICASKGQCK
ncbi:MAG: HAD hydrolase family protein, partial [Kiritimatiellae bacterium]|nr:HAD hydrolase family protein [Kiritimatiellia bacterium]